MNQKSKRGGKRAGAGRPKGSKEPQTLEREAVLKEYRARVCGQAQRLLDAELTVAQGCSYLYRKRKSAPKSEPRKVDRVTDPETIKRFLDGELDHDETDWYFITTEKPDTLTIRGMFDRLWDKPSQRQEVTGADGSPLVPPVTRVIHTFTEDDGSTR